MKKGCEATAGSKLLSGFVAPFDATVVTRMSDHGVAVKGPVKMSEFGLWDLFGAEDCPETGAVSVVAGGVVSFALCNDVFGQNRRQAAENGLCYLHPTYGTVSRYGLIPQVSSMDQIGVVCRNLSEGFSLLSAIAGNDEKDGAMFPEKRRHYVKSEKRPRLGIPRGVIDRADENTKNALRRFACEFDSVSAELPYFDLYKQVMYILCSAELSANISRYDGIKFGARAEGYNGVEELYTKTRTEGFSLPVKLAAIMGSAVLSGGMYAAYYEKAMRLRRLIKESVSFDEYDVALLPLTVGESRYDDLSLYALAPLAGFASATFSFDGAGIQLIADVNNENALLTAWEVTR